MSLFKVTINWPEVAKIASVKYGKKVHPAHCRDVYSGNHNSPKLLQVIREILKDTKQKTRKEGTSIQ